MASAFPVGLLRGKRANIKIQFLTLRYPAVSDAGVFILSRKVRPQPSPSFLFHDFLHDSVS